MHGETLKFVNLFLLNVAFLQHLATFYSSLVWNSSRLRKI